MKDVLMRAHMKDVWEYERLIRAAMKAAETIEQDSGERFIFGSYANELARMHGVICSVLKLRSEA